MANSKTHVDGQQHPLSMYFSIWVLLFVLSTFSYLVDYYHVEGYLRWTLIIIFMLLKAGLIISVFMHMMWERMALIYALALPLFAVGVFITLMSIESDYTNATRDLFFGP